jgi:hypothetical protein
MVAAAPLCSVMSKSTPFKATYGRNSFSLRRLQRRSMNRQRRKSF